MHEVTVLFATTEGQTARIAEHIAAQLRRRGHRVEVAPASSDQLELTTCAGVIIGASVHYGHHPAWLARLLRARDLRGLKSAFFSVSLGAKKRYATRFLRRARWTPDLVGVFRGALLYSKYGPLKRLVVRTFAAIAGHDTDTSRDYEYTEWKAVERFASAFSETLTSAS
jgi:menaquinone-dependent protoporphyrinogen oxidase